MSAMPPQSRAIARDILIVAAVGACLWIANRLGRIVLMLILAGFVAYAMAPVVDMAQRPIMFRGRRRHLPRAAAIALVYVLLAGVVAAAAVVLWPAAAQQLHDAIANVPEYTASFHTWEQGWTKYYERLRIPLEVRDSIDQAVLGAGEAFVAFARGSLMGLVGLLSDLPWLILVPVFAFLLLKDASGIRRTILIALPHSAQLRSHRLLEDLNATLASYVRAQLIASVVVGVLVGAGLALLGNPYAILLGAAAAVLECVPLIGPLIIGVAAVTIAALHSPVLAVWTAVFLAGLRMVEDYVIYPRLIGRGIHMHPFVVILAVLAGVELGGVPGALIAVPLVALLSVVVRHWRRWRDGEPEPVIAPAETPPDPASPPDSAAAPVPG